MHLFLREGSLPPAEIADQFGPVRHRLQRPQSDHARQRRGIVACPVHRPRLLFDHPPPAICGTAAIQVMVEGRDIGMPLPDIIPFVGLAETEHFQEAKRIAVPHHAIEVAAQIVVIVIGKETHRVVHHIAARRQFADDIDLRAVERGDLIRRKPPECQPVRGIGFGNRQIGQIDLVETAIFHAPEHIAPCSVQRINRSVAIGQPNAECQPRRIGIADHSIVAAIFVVGLPHHHRRMIAVSLRIGASDTRRLFAVAAMAEAIVPARSEAALAALLVRRHHIGHLVDQPFGRGRGRRAQDHAQTGIMQNIDSLIEPAPVETARLRLYPAPCKFADPYAGDSGLGHMAGVSGPVRLRPVFRIVTNPKPHMRTLPIQLPTAEPPSLRNALPVLRVKLRNCRQKILWESEALRNRAKQAIEYGIEGGTFG